MEISAEMVRDLRSKSGAGIMDCKQALSETSGNVEDAVTFLRKKGLAKADKKTGREAKDGGIASYIHPGNKIGVLLQLHCETDFVANTNEFQTLLKDLCMHIAAAKPKFISRDDVTPEDLEKEREIFIYQAKESGKPEKVIEKIVTGKMEKFYEENCFLDQSFVKDTSVSVQDLIKQTVAVLGENITVGDFSRLEISK